MSASDHPNERQGTFAEEWVADYYDVEHAPNETDWYDCVDPQAGAKYEVKSTHKHVDGGVVSGRFRVWEDQHRSVRASDRKGAAWYVFVLLEERNGSADVVDHRRVEPATVWAIVKQDGGDWNRSGHQRQSRQHKIPWEQVMDR